FPARFTDRGVEDLLLDRGVNGEFVEHLAAQFAHAGGIVLFRGAAEAVEESADLVVIRFEQLEGVHVHLSVRSSALVPDNRLVKPLLWWAGVDPRNLHSLESRCHHANLPTSC